jgi:hypothetical protein
MTLAIIVCLSAVALYLGTLLFGARAENAELQVQNARLKKRIERDAR